MNLSRFFSLDTWPILRELCFQESGREILEMAQCYLEDGEWFYT